MSRSKHLPKEIAFEPEQFRIAAEYAPVHMIFADADGIIVYANPAAEKITGYSRKEMIGKQLKHWGGTMPKQFYENMWHTVKTQKKAFHGELDQLRMNGEAYTAEIWITPVVIEGKKLSGFVGVEMDVSDRKKLLGSIQESEERLRQITENIEEVFFLIDPKSLQTFYISPAFEKLWGRKPSKVRHADSAWINTVFKEDHLAVERAVKAAARGKSSDVEFRIIRANDRSERWMNAHIFPVFDKRGRAYRLAGVATDVTDELTANIEKSRLASEMTLILSSTVEAIVRVDEHDRCVFVNRAASAILGYTAGELVGKNMHKAIHHTRLNGKPYPERQCPISKALTSDQGALRLMADTFYRKDGSPIPVVYNAASIIKEGQSIGGVLTFVDATEKLNSEARVKELDDLKDKFIRIVSHQLRAPLSAVRWNLEMLLSGESSKINPESESLVRVSYEATSEVIRRINDLLTALDIEEGKIKLEKEELDLKGLISGIMGEATKRCESHALTCKFVLGKVNLPLVRVDAIKLRVALSKIIDNAVQYSKSGGAVTVQIKQMKDIIRIQVSDKGIGIPKSEQKRVFTRFFRASNASIQVQDASGLGLYIAKYYVEAHGGTIGFKSDEGRGSTFWIDLPTA